MEQGFTGTLLQGAGNTSSSAISATVSNQTNTEQSSTTTQQQVSIPIEVSNTNIPSTTSQQQQEASPLSQDSRNKRNSARRKPQSQHSVSVLNTPGTIDSDYRGELKVIIYNHGSQDFIVNNNDRIAQMILTPVIKMELQETNELPESVRGEGGFGSTGK